LVVLLEDFIISLKDITVRFGKSVILENFNLDIVCGKFITLLGPSGCGKTTVLRLIGGFQKPQKGDIFFEKEKITDLPACNRKVNTVFQKYALFPNFNVYENIAFGLKVAKKSEKEVKERVNEMLEIVGLASFANYGVNSLSGGQQQRVAVARALANSPKVLLLDEPFAALDLRLRKDMQSELKKIQTQTGITFVFVTHDQEEALSMSDTVAVMEKGKIQQIGTPLEIYNEPKNAFVADFIGESNIIDGIMISDYIVKFAENTFECLDKGFASGEHVDVVIRPEDIKLVSPEKGKISGVVTSVTFKGVHNEIITDINGFKWMIQSTEYRSIGDIVGLSLVPDDIHIMEKSIYSSTIGDYSAFSDEFYGMLGR
jgi:spermidine/putrescine transport system ATP-binding protein